MSKNTDKSTTNSENVVQFINESQVIEELGEATASTLFNPLVTWAKFVLTDDMPNGNRERVSVAEFDNIIKSGTHMPVKMAEGKIGQGHDNSKPLGVIAHIKKDIIEGRNVLVALAALWNDERESDISHLKQLMQNKEDINISWELKYGKRVQAEAGISDLLNVVMKAATIVARPAYQGRTRFLAIASAEDWSEDFITNLPDSSFLYLGDGQGKDLEGRTEPLERKFAYRYEDGTASVTRLNQIIEEEIPNSNLSSKTKKVILSAAKAVLKGVDNDGEVLLSENKQTEERTVDIEQLTQKLAEVEGKLAVALSQLQEKEEVLVSTKASIDTLAGEKTVLETEVTELREFKGTVEAEKAKTEKLGRIKSKFAEAGLSKDEQYFTDNEGLLIGLDENALNFMVQELSAFSKQDASASTRGTKIPNIPGSQGKTSDISELVKALKENKAK